MQDEALQAGETARKKLSVSSMSLRRYVLFCVLAFFAWQWKKAVLLKCVITSLS